MRAIETPRERPWSTTIRVTTDGGVAWFKACAANQVFEPRLTAALYERWPDRVPEVLAHDERRAWLLLADAGTPIRELGNPPETWLDVLPAYAELQRGETARAPEHVAHGVPDLRVGHLRARYDDLLRHDLPLEAGETDRLRAFAPRFARLCGELAMHDVGESVQHDDLHGLNVFVRDGHLRVLDWGDASIGHPFASLVVVFRFLDEWNGLPPGDQWFARLRDAYLEPWGPDLVETFELAMRVGIFGHAIAWLRVRDLLPAAARPDYDVAFATILRRALTQRFSAG